MKLRICKHLKYEKLNHYLLDLLKYRLMFLIAVNKVKVILASVFAKIYICLI